MTSSLFGNTPSITVLDNRGLAVRSIAYHRHPDAPSVTSERITRHRHCARGFLAQSADPRLHEAGVATRVIHTGLGGLELRVQSVDAGITFALDDTAARGFMSLTNVSHDASAALDLRQAVARRFHYEGAHLPGRMLAISEQTRDEAARIVERFVYADDSEQAKNLNLRGQCVSHYDPAGLVQTDSVALTGNALSVTRRLLGQAHDANVISDWQGEDASAWNRLLAPQADTTRTSADATGNLLTTLDARGNLQRMAYDVAGLHAGSWLTLKDGSERVVFSAITYSASGQRLREVHGNGVITTYAYEAKTQRLSGIRTERPTTHALGAKVLQDLRYQYDPVGNVLTITNDAEKTRFWRNQKVEPERRYTYDSLYQLVQASGREMAGGARQAQRAAVVPVPNDGAAYTNYTRTYRYDAGGNLTQIRHSAPATGNNHTTDITISDRSNRGVSSALTQVPSEVDALFTAGGCQTLLKPGQRLAWTARGELRSVASVTRDDAAHDEELYRYDASGQRRLKVTLQRSSSAVRTQQVVYLPELELRTTHSDGTLTQALQVITLGDTGRMQARALHWQSAKPEGIDNDQIRYSYGDLIGSSNLELDSDGNVISLEEYYPYGGTALWAARSAVEANYKTIRYSGKERDATGLYYYGYRYYQSWVGRWLSADPAGTIDGLNLYRMVRNNPVTLKDDFGLVGGSVADKKKLFETQQPTKASVPPKKPLPAQKPNFTPTYGMQPIPSSDNTPTAKPTLFKRPTKLTAPQGNAPLETKPAAIVEPQQAVNTVTAGNPLPRKLTGAAAKGAITVPEGSLKPGDRTFDTAILGGNPIKKDILGNVPLPAQAEAFRSVIEEKIAQTAAGGKPKAIDVWQNTQNGNIHILDGQHRFLAAAELGIPIELNWKKLGFPAFQGGWRDTYYSKGTPAKETLKSQMVRK